MKVTLLLFAGFRDALGDRIVLDLPTGSTVAQVRERLAADHADQEGLLRVSRFARDVDFVPDDTELEDGVELALIPPVSGG